MKINRLGVTLSLLIFTAGCGAGGMSSPTDSGNGEDITPGPAQTSPGAGGGTTAGILISLVCSKLADCFDQYDQYNTCVQRMWEVETIDTEIGLDRSAYEDLRGVADAEIAGEITPDQSAFDNCRADFVATTCDEIVTSGAYDPSRSADFSGIQNILSTRALSCPNVFTQETGSRNPGLAPEGTTDPDSPGFGTSF